jgi:hypothetical protein
MIALTLISLLLISSGSVVISPGTMTSVPDGYAVSNLDPTFNSTYNNEIYDPNFLPGFEAGLTDTTVSWTSGNGYGSLGYSVGPWTHEEGNGIPHFAVGPQCCNFVEVPHTQQFRLVDWGDYYYVRSALGSPGINVENYTAAFGGPVTYVGLRTDWDWKIQLSLKWGNPVMMNSSNEWGAIGIDMTQVVPSAPGELVYTLINFWMDSNSSRVLAASSRDGRWVGGSNLVTYHPVQIAGGGNETITVDISPYLEDTLQALGLTQYQSQPPLITYVYMNVEGYNFGWNATLWSFKVMTPTNTSKSTIPFASVFPIVFLAAAVAAFAFAFRRYRVREGKNVSSSFC